MRRAMLAMSMLAVAAAAPATAHAADTVGAPITHGPDPVAVAAGPESPAVPLLAAKRRVAAKVVPAAWCGSESAADDVVDEVDNGPYRYHGVYMLPADAPDRFASLATA